LRRRGSWGGELRRQIISGSPARTRWIEQIRVATEMTKPKGHAEHFTFHDLRRTAAAGMAGMKTTRFLIDRILNHTDPGVGATYDRHEYEAEKRDALTKWDVKLAEMVQ
jgi:integrase